jgi:hypothetical protein
MNGGFLLNAIVAHSAAVLQPLACEYESLLVSGDAFLLLDLGLNCLNAVHWLNIDGDCSAGEGLNEYLHVFG